MPTGHDGVRVAPTDEDGLAGKTKATRYFTRLFSRCGADLIAARLVSMNQDLHLATCPCPVSHAIPLRLFAPGRKPMSFAASPHHHSQLLLEPSFVFLHNHTFGEETGAVITSYP
jgi:hypothetical protein